jgi:hypothetical protein
MTKTKQDPVVDQIIGLLSRVREDAKAEGAAETIARLKQFTDAGSLQTGDTPKLASGRAPMGTARALIERALKKAGGPLTAAEIKNHATNSAERGLAQTSIYNELSKGLTEGRYERDDNRRWAITG